MKRTLLLAAMISILAVSSANALTLQVQKKNGKGDVVLKFSMSQQDYSAAIGMMGGHRQMNDMSIPGMNSVNVAVPRTKAEYDRMRTNAVNQAKSSDKQWCVTCTTGGSQFTVTARHAVGAALIGTKQCDAKVKNQDVSVADQPGACALVGNP